MNGIAHNAVARVAEDFAHDDPRTLELLATVLFMWNSELRLYRRATGYQVLRKVQRYKGPKFTSSEIDTALTRLRTEGYLRS